MTALTEIADRQSLWSKTADTLKSSINFARRSTFVLSILGALLATIASQLDQPQLRLYLAISGAVVFAIMSFVASRILTGSNIPNWIRARAASEALKREAYKYAARAAPYNDPANRDALLNDERSRIEQDVDDLIGLQVATRELGSLPREELTRDAYVTRRVLRQIEYYRDNAEEYRQRAKGLRWAELTLALAATVITAVVGVAGKEAFGFKFDFVAITAVLTTITGAILAHIESSRFEFLVTSYRATERRLSSELARVQDVKVITANEWDAFVQRCETILSEESAGWIAKWSKSPK